jgi:hypothetical protein
MTILYRFRRRHSGTKTYYEITAGNGSVFNPIPSLEDLRLYIAERFKASDSECARIIKKIEQTGESFAYLPDGKELTAVGVSA